MSMVHVVAVITAKPGLRAQVLEAFNANVPAVHAEDGCIEYGATIDSPDAGKWAAAFVTIGLGCAIVHLVSKVVPEAARRRVSSDAILDPPADLILETREKELV